jgi:trehalose 6-phosphate synthase
VGERILSRLIAISNRVAAPSGGKSAGGLAVGVLAALRQAGGIWFGWGGQTCRGEPAEPRLERRGRITFATIDISEADFDSYYNGYCNATLWPLFHYMLGFFRYDRASYDAYRRVNALFARKLKPLLEPGDRIWVHDYHFIPLAEELRQAGVRNPIGFFLHVPFPGIDVLRTLPLTEGCCGPSPSTTSSDSRPAGTATTSWSASRAPDSAVSGRPTGPCLPWTGASPWMRFP